MKKLTKAQKKDRKLIKKLLENSLDEMSKAKIPEGTVPEIPPEILKKLRRQIGKPGLEKEIKEIREIALRVFLLTDREIAKYGWRFASVLLRAAEKSRISKAS